MKIKQCTAKKPFKVIQITKDVLTTPEELCEFVKCKSYQIDYTKTGKRITFASDTIGYTKLNCAYIGDWIFSDNNHLLFVCTNKYFQEHYTLFDED